MSANSDHPTLIIEPNKDIVFPYKYLPQNYISRRVSSIDKALKLFSYGYIPSVVLISASFEPDQSLSFLETIKMLSTNELIAIVMIVDFTNRLNFVPGTTWGNKMAVVDAHITLQEINLTLERILGK